MSNQIDSQEDGCQLERLVCRVFSLFFMLFRRRQKRGARNYGDGQIITHQGWGEVLRRFGTVGGTTIRGCAGTI